MAKVPRKAKKAVKPLDIARPRPKFEVVGRVKQGKLEIDDNKLRAFTKGMENKDVWFVALNAPFKTRSLIGAV